MQYESLESAQTSFSQLSLELQTKSAGFPRISSLGFVKFTGNLARGTEEPGLISGELSQQNIIMLRSNVITKSTLLSFKENTLKIYYVNENGSFDREVRSSK